MQSVGSDNLDTRKMEEDVVFAEQEVNNIQEFMEDETSAIKKIQEYFEQLDEMVLNIAVTGESGKGKSTFINAIRGLGDEEGWSAPTGVVETTMEPTPYHFPNDCNVTLWDLPGIGTENFKADQYLDIVEFHRYDFFIIVSSERFTSNDAKLAREIQNMGKHFYLVRSKIDQSLLGEKRKKSYNEEATLDRIRQDCVTGLQKLGVGSPKVFLICSFHLDKYDFSRLQQVVEKELQDQKRHIFLLSLPNISSSVLQKKKEVLQANVWKLALLAASLAALPLAGIPFAVNAAILVKEISKYHKAFGLDEASLECLAEQAQVPMEELKKSTKSGINPQINAEVVTEMLRKVAGNKLVLCSILSIPLLGPLPAGGLAYWNITKLLTFCLNELAEDARLVLLRAFQNEG